MSNKVPCPGCYKPVYKDIWAMRNFGVCMECYLASSRREREFREEQNTKWAEERGMGGLLEKCRDMTKQLFGR